MSNSVKIEPIEQSNSVSKLPSNSRNLNWSLKPLTVCMTLIGASPPSLTNSACQFSRFFRPLFFLFILLIHLWSSVNMLLNVKLVTESYTKGISTAASSLNFIIDNHNFSMYVIGGHGFLLFLTRSEVWSQLTKPFMLLETNLETKLQIYLKTRKFAVYFTIFNVASVHIFFIFMMLDVIEIVGPLERKCLDVLSVSTLIVPVTALTLFCTLAYLTSLHLGSIHTSIEELLTSCQPLESQRLRLIVLEKRHLLICKAIEQLNRYFGIFLVIEVVYDFVGVINCTMHLVIATMSGVGLLGAINVLIFIAQVFKLFLLTSFSDEIGSQIDKIFEALINLMHHQRPLQDEIRTFSEQISNVRPQINAMGFFKVSKQLFPMLVGTTLTYFLILLQFHLSENR